MSCLRDTSHPRWSRVINLGHSNMGNGIDALSVTEILDNNREGMAPETIELIIRIGTLDRSVSRRILQEETLREWEAKEAFAVKTALAEIHVLAEGHGDGSNIAGSFCRNLGHNLNIRKRRSSP